MDIFKTYFIPCVSAYFACLGFSVVFNVRGRNVPVVCLGGSLGWLVYLLGGKSIIAAFFAAVAIGVFAETMARLNHCPVTGYVLIALLPLVPGGGIYYAMRYALMGYTDLFAITLLNTFGIAAALAVGAMISSSVFRAVYAHWRRSMQKKRGE